MLFLNIGWMREYRGRTETADRILGGGQWVEEHGHGHEVCNFLPCPDARVYGHVETIHGDRDRQIRLEKFGGDLGDESLQTDVIWTATHPEEGGRRVVGWYRNATVHRHRQQLDPPPTAQHVLDGINTYRVSADWRDATLLPPARRLLKLRRGKGWMGHTQWWSPRQRTRPISRFLDELGGLMALEECPAPNGPPPPGGDRRTPGTASGEYTKYISSYEIAVTPRHRELQNAFVRYAQDQFRNIEEDVESVDVRFAGQDGRVVLAEVKPCDHTTARFAIRTAIGQLLDYGQRFGEDHSRLIILDCDPGDENRRLAFDNGFGISFRSGNDFDTTWPT